jgi:hypothetical protein
MQPLLRDNVTDRPSGTCLYKSELDSARYSKPLNTDVIYVNLEMEIKMSNVGSTDRIIRVILGLALVAAPFVITVGLWDNAALRWGVPAVGVVLILTSLFRFCPAYRLLGMNTCGLR